MKKIALTLVCCICILALYNVITPPQPLPDSDSTTTKTSDTVSNTTAVTDGWKIGVQMWTFRMFTFTEALDKVDSAGVKYIEAFWGQPLGGGMKDSFGIKMSDDSKAKLKQMLQTKGISIVAMGVISPGTTEEWKKAFDLAKEFGLSYITAEPHKDQWNMVDSMAGAYGIKDGYSRSSEAECLLEP